MGRPTTANMCRQETEVIVVVTGKTALVACGKAQGHPGAHQKGTVIWDKRAASPPDRRPMR